ncbi:hypothetical protein J7L68_07855 [bacterium]|nr:hypothetical protein [bacterium]
MAQRLLLIRYESGHALRAVATGGDPYTEGINLIDHADGFYSVTLPVDVYDIYYKVEPDDSTWIPLEHYQGRFHPTDEITDDISSIQSDVSSLDGRVSVLEGEIPNTPQNIQSIYVPDGIHIKWQPKSKGTIYIIRGIYHHTDEQIMVDENSRILYSGHIPECILPDAMRFADIQSKPYGDIILSYKIWAYTPAGTSNPTDINSIALDLTSERADFCDSISLDCNNDSAACRISYMTIHYPGAFPKTELDSQNLPAGEPARTISFPRDTKIMRMEIESISLAENDCTIYIADKFSGAVYSLKIDSSERFARSEQTSDGNPNIRILRYPDSELYIYSDNAMSLQDIEIRLTVGVI